MEDAERLFQAAIQEAKEGFGERDPHVASACNNLVGPPVDIYIRFNKGRVWLDASLFHVQ